MGMLREFDEVLAGVERAKVGVVLLRGEGDRFFCAGADISEWGPLSPDAMGRQWIREGNRVFQRLATQDAVVIAMINGDALGGGLELGLCADIRIASDSARFGFPEVGIGAIPGWMGCTRLQEAVGQGRAKQMILTGEPIGAAKAEQWGLVNEVMAPKDLEARAENLAAIIGEKSSVAISVAKRLLNVSVDVDRFAGMHELAASAIKATPDAAEGLVAFKEKRKATFPGSA
jgi:enoyl-CoA hydratase